MSKHSLQKNTMLLTMFAAVLASASLVEAEETSLATTTTTPVASQVETPVTSTATNEAATDATTALNASPVLPQEGDTVDVRILSTTDLHTNLVNYDYYQDKPSQNIGLAKTAVLIDKAKAENPNTLLVDNGDTIQGTPLGTYKSIIDPVEAVKAVIPDIQKAGADIILVLSHSGIGDDVYEVGEEKVGYQIAGIDGVDAVITEHSHAEFPSGKGAGFYEKYKDVDGVNGLITGTPVTMAGKYGDRLGIIDLGLTRMNGKP